MFTFSLMFGNLHFYLFSEHQRFSSLEGRGLGGGGYAPQESFKSGFSEMASLYFSMQISY